jgi:HAD superfamily hydrolase (TIGR01459 family)
MSDEPRPATTRPVPGLKRLAGRYDMVLCDVWGVLHDGLVAFPGASDALTRFRARGGTVVLVSNAPRPGLKVARQLDRLGVPRTAYDAIITSGDLTREAVIVRAGQAVHQLGPERDLSIYDGLDVRFGTPETADYVVCTGLVDDERETAEDYRATLEVLRARNLWMACANPDLVVERGERLIPCAGAIAALYETLGGEVYYAGKPHRPVYEAAVALAEARRDGPLEPGRILAVGDAMHTDIAGAAGFGIDSLFIARGIHAAELGASENGTDPAQVAAFLAAQAMQPAFWAETLLWEGEDDAPAREGGATPA